MVGIGYMLSPPSWWNDLCPGVWLCSQLDQFKLVCAWNDCWLLALKRSWDSDDAVWCNGYAGQ